MIATLILLHISKMFSSLVYKTTLRMKQTQAQISKAIKHLVLRWDFRNKIADCLTIFIVGSTNHKKAFYDVWHSSLSRLRKIRQYQKGSKIGISKLF